MRHSNTIRRSTQGLSSGLHARKETRHHPPANRESIRNLNCNQKETKMNRHHFSNQEIENHNTNSKENTMNASTSFFSARRSLSLAFMTLIYLLTLTVGSSAFAQFGAGGQFLNPDLPGISPRPQFYGDGLGHCRLGDEVITTEVSGEVSDVTEVLSGPNSDFYALKKIENREHRDNPCRTELTFGRLSGARALSKERGVVSNSCNGTARDDIEVGATPYTPPGVFIGSIAVWTNGKTNADDRRLKGLSVMPRTVSRDCEVNPGVAAGTFDTGFGDGSHDYGGTTITWEEYDKRTHAVDLYDRRYCPAGYVATGLVLHSGDRGVYGVQLECREVLDR